MMRVRRFFLPKEMTTNGFMSQPVRVESTFNVQLTVLDWDGNVHVGKRVLGWSWWRARRGGMRGLGCMRMEGVLQGREFRSPWEAKHNPVTTF
jgi:hypothetical protein